MKTIVVSGATGFLGTAVCEKFLASGDRVIGISSGSRQTTFQQEERYDNRIADLKDESSSGKLIEDIVARYHSIDAAVLTAGGFAMGKLRDTSSKEIQQQLELNFDTAYHLAKPVLEQMIKQGSGRIFLIGSRAGLDSREGANSFAYGLSKSLLFRMAEYMNEVSKKSSVFTAVIVPSIIDTPVNRQAMPNATFSSWVTPASIADVIYFYSGDSASIIREPVIKVYGNA